MGVEILPIKQRMRWMRETIAERLDTVLPAAMRAADLDCWLVLCQEDNEDPVFRTLIPPDAWCPILQILAFFDHGDRVERVSFAMTGTGGLYEQPWTGRDSAEQWALLAGWLAERQPRRIGLNIGSVQWAAGGLTHNLYTQLGAAVGESMVARFVSAEPLVVHWMATLTARQIDAFETTVSMAHEILAHCLSDEVIEPDRTSTEDLEWYYWQTAVDLGLELSFRPFFRTIRSDEAKARYGAEDRVIRCGDLVHSDVGIRYLGLCSDHQRVAYVRRPGEQAAPASWLALFDEAHRLQDCFCAEFVAGLSGDELLSRILGRARAEGVASPKVYSHSLGHLLHEPGPLIGLPWQQDGVPGRGDVRLGDGMAFTMELSVTGPIAEWGGQVATLPLEEDVVFSQGRCSVVDGRQETFYLI